MRREDGTADQVLARMATDTHGVVTRSEVLKAGVTLGELRHRLRSGALLRVYRGVYRVGHRAPSLEARYLAAVRACGTDALLIARPAGHLLGLVSGPAPPSEVAAPVARRIPGVTTRQRRAIDPRDVTVWRGVPVTTAPATLVDLAGVLPFGDLARAFHQAEVLHRVTPGAVTQALARRPNSPGAARLAPILTGDARVTLSRLEARFLERLGEAGLPLPETNRRAGSHWVDCRWPERRLTVELDSYRFHHSRHAWEKDHAREREAHARGDDYRRYTYADVFEDPEPMLAELRALLSARRPIQGSQNDT